MKIIKIEDLHCDAGWRVNSFLKITTDEGIVGWSEYMEGYGAQGLTGVIQKLAERFLIGRDPRPVEAISALLYAATRQAAGGVNQMAIAAIENALVDLKAKALGIPVYEMLGGPVRDRLQLYWSHCGTTRVRAAWTAFATTGDPGWPTYDAGGRSTWIIDTDPAVKPYPEEISRRLWADHPFTPLDLTAAATG
jgi:L-alanine-DL-glutamate epimerase-like enolase superfamily enzyme